MHAVHQGGPAGSAATPALSKLSPVHVRRTARAVRIVKTYGADSIQVMGENPYRLPPDIRGIGFKTADAIASAPGATARGRWHWAGSCCQHCSRMGGAEGGAGNHGGARRARQVELCGDRLWRSAP